MLTFASNLPDELVRQGLNLNGTHDFKLGDAKDQLKKEIWNKEIVPYSQPERDGRFLWWEFTILDLRVTIF